MTRKWVELLYNNQSALNSAAPAIDEFEENELLDPPVAFDPDLNVDRSSFLLRDQDFRVLNSLERLNAASELTNIEEQLRRLKQMMLHVSLEMRLNVLIEFNTLLRTLSYSHAEDKRVFRHCLEVIVDFKRQMDKRDQEQSSRIKAEWVQLEKAIYYLTVWESQMDRPRELFV